VTLGLVIACLLHIPLAVLVALAVAALVDPPVAGGSRAVGVGLGLWLCLAGSLALLAAALMALRRPGSPRRQRGELVAGRPEAAAVATVSQVTCQSRSRSTRPPALRGPRHRPPRDESVPGDYRGSGSTGLVTSHAGQ
jgi:hypothetical protein